MRTVYFVLPGTDRKFACGGLLAELKIFELAKQLCHAELVTYKQREKGKLFLRDLLKHNASNNGIFVICWGWDIPELVSRLKGYNVVYHAHSAGYGFSLPAGIPIIAVSRNTMGFWGQKSPNALIYYLPNQVSDEFYNRNSERDIDVLVQTRKSSEYLIKSLVPALQQSYEVVVQNAYVEDLAALFNQAKVYLYDSSEDWAQKRVTEGFGLPPLEALACGCTVFSSVNGGLSDFLDPGFNCYKIAGYARDHDVQRIRQVLASPPPTLPDAFFSEYRAVSIVSRLNNILKELNEFFDFKKSHSSDIPTWTANHPTYARQLASLLLMRALYNLATKRKIRDRNFQQILDLTYELEKNI
jgi:hypothetical protein